jgi:hypothetical protein
MSEDIITRARVLLEAGNEDRLAHVARELIEKLYAELERTRRSRDRIGLYGEEQGDELAEVRRRLDAACKVVEAARWVYDADSVGYDQDATAALGAALAEYDATVKR